MSDEVVKKVTVDVGAKNTTDGGLGEVKSSVKKSFDDVEKEAKAHHSRLKAILEDVSEGVGKRSQLKEVLELIEGGGAVAGLTLAGRITAEWTEKLKEAQVQLALGEKDAGEITDQLLRGLPVLGNLYTTGRNIREIMDGTAVAVARANEEAKLSVEHAEAVKKYLEESKALLESMERGNAGLQVNIDMAKAKREFGEMWETGSKKIQLEFDLKVDGLNLSQRLEEEQRKFETEFKSEIEEYRKAIGQKMPDQTYRHTRPNAQGFLDTFDDPNPEYAAAQEHLTSVTKAHDQALEVLAKRVNAIKTLARERDELLRSKFTAETGFSAETSLKEFETLGKEIGGGKWKSTLLAGFESAKAFVASQWASFSKAASSPGDLEIQKSLNAIEAEFMRARAATGGGPELEFEAAKLQLHQSYLEQEQQLLQLSRDKLASDLQRVEAAKLLLSLAQREALDVAKLRRDQFERLRAPLAVAEVGGSTAALAAVQEYAIRQANLFKIDDVPASSKQTPDDFRRLSETLIDGIANGPLARLFGIFTSSLDKTDSKTADAVNDLKDALRAFTDKFTGKELKVYSIRK